MSLPLSIGGTWEEASVNGTLKPQGWGADMGFPGIVLDEAGDEVEGYVFCSDKLTDHWAELDAFEGDEYERMLVNVDREGKTAVSAYIYILREN